MYIYILIYIYSCQVIWKTLNAEFFLRVYLGGESGGVGWGVVIRNPVRIPVRKTGNKAPGSNPLDTWPGIGTQSRYKAPGDLWTESVKRMD